MKNKKIKLMIATPAYDKKVFAHYAISLLNTRELLNSQDIEVTVQFRLGDSLLVCARNTLLEDFWNSDSTHMLCIDADIGWPPMAVLSMLQVEKDVVAGVYPSRWDNGGFIYTPSLDSNKNKIMENHLVKMEYVPAGFIMITKNVLKKMREKFSNLYYESDDLKEKGYCLFDTEVLNERLWGEDYVFCRRITEAGFDIWVDPLIYFEHGDKKGAMGKLASGKNPYEPLVEK